MIAFVQGQAGNSGGYVNSYTITVASAVTAGSFLSLCLGAGSADSVLSITDNKGNSWLADEISLGNDRQAFLYHVDNAVAGATVITITFAASTYPDTTYEFREFSGVQASPSSLDKIAAANSGTSYVESQSSGITGVTTNAVELVISNIVTDASANPLYTPPTGFTGLLGGLSNGGYTYGASAYQIVSATGAQGGNWTWTNAYQQAAAAIATYSGVATTTTTTTTLAPVSVTFARSANSGGFYGA